MAKIKTKTAKKPLNNAEDKAKDPDINDVKRKLAALLLYQQLHKEKNTKPGSLSNVDKSDKEASK